MTYTSKTAKIKKGDYSILSNTLTFGREISQTDGTLPEASCFVDAIFLSSASIVEQTS